MKRYNPLFTESYLTTISIMGKNVDIYIHPKAGERNKLKTEYVAMRGVINEKGTITLWRGNATHTDVIQKLKNDPDFKKLYTGDHFNYEDRNYITIIIEKDDKIYLGDGEKLSEIEEMDEIDLAVMVYNATNKYSWVKFSNDFRGVGK